MNGEARLNDFNCSEKLYAVCESKKCGVLGAPCCKGGSSAVPATCGVGLECKAGTCELSCGNRGSPCCNSVTGPGVAGSPGSVTSTCAGLPGLACHTGKCVQCGSKGGEGLIEVEGKCVSQTKADVMAAAAVVPGGHTAAVGGEPSGAAAPGGEGPDLGYVGQYVALNTRMRFPAAYKRC